MSNSVDDYSLPSTKIYCEDDYFEEYSSSSYRYHLKCDQTIQTVPKRQLSFNYTRFNEYLKLKTDIKCISQSVEASQGISSPGLDYYTDERLQQELFNVYGDLDKYSERFHLIFRNYKEQRLEQVQEWIDREKEVLKRGIQKNELFQKEEEYFLRYFTEKEITSFKTVASGSTDSFNPFILPRKISPLRNNEQSQKTTTVSRKGRANKGHLAQRNEVVASEVKNVLQQNPTGLTRDRLLEICNERLDRKVPPGGVLINLNLEIIDGYLRKEKVLVWKPFFLEGGIVFPFPKSPHSVVSVVPDPLDILWNLRHKLLVILRLCLGIVEVDECIDLCNKIFKTGVFPYNKWGFQTCLDLVKWLFQENWRNHGVEVIQLNLGGKGKSGTKYYLAVMTKQRKSLLEGRMASVNSVKKNKSCDQIFTNSKNKVNKCSQNISTSKNEERGDNPVPSTSLSSNSPWNKQAPAGTVRQQPHKPQILNYDPTATFIDSKYVQIGEKIVREENEIRPGTGLDCVVSVVNTSTNFYLVRKSKWEDLNRLFGELSEDWTLHPRALCPHPRFLQRNYLCLAKTDNVDQVEVYRVVILQRLDNNHYQVFCIDYGDILKVRHDQLRYMPKDAFYILNAQAISCSMYNVASPTKDSVTGNDVWSKSVCDYTRNLLCPNDLPKVKVIFKQRVNGTGKWLVKLSVGKQLDLGEDVMKFVNKAII